MVQGAGFKGKCGAQIRKRRIYKSEAHRFYPLPLEGGGPEGRGLGEEAAARANLYRFAVANLHH